MNSFEKFDKPPSKDRFAKQVIDAIRKAGEKDNIRYDREEFRLTGEGQGRHICNLENIYREYCGANQQIRSILMRNFVRSWFAHEKGVPESFEDVNPDLLPVVRARGYYEVTSLQLRAQGMNDAGCPYRPVAEHLAVGLGYDLPESIVQIRQDNLTTWGVTFEQALEAACENLRGVSDQGLQEAAPGVWRSPWHDNYDAARLMLLDMVRSYPVEGDPVVMTPNRDTLLLTGSDDVDGLTTMATLAEEAMGHARTVSGLAARLNGETWLPFLPTAKHPAFQKLKLLATRSLSQDYNAQKEALDTLYEKTEEDDVIVGSFSLMQHKDTGAVTSYTVWSESDDTLLPGTELVAFLGRRSEADAEVLGMFPWERVEAIVGSLMTRLEMYPPRWRVEAFPSAEQFARMKE
jgi:uncharacterized protein YtpQ (UPF0354 family)